MSPPETLTAHAGQTHTYSHVLLLLLCGAAASTCRYRRNGHNEQDDPSVTLPLSYELIRGHPPVMEIYASKLLVRAVQAAGSACFGGWGPGPGTASVSV